MREPRYQSALAFGVLVGLFTGLGAHDNSWLVILAILIWTTFVVDRWVRG